MKPKNDAISGQCLCGAVKIEIDIPAFWAWHDHSKETQIAHGSACATYVGCWRRKVRIVKGADAVAAHTTTETKTTRSFCKHCGTPLMVARSRDGKMVNLPRALFSGRTGREPRYHVGVAESPEWAYRQEPLKPLKGYPGVLVVRSTRTKAADHDPIA
jgi:hypothetical protein